MAYALKQTVAPTEEPVTIDEAKAQVHIDEADDLSLLSGMIAAGTRYVETLTRRQLVTATFTFKLDKFPSKRTIRLPRPPTQSLTKIEYIDTGGDLQTLDASVYDLDTDSEPARVSLAFGQVWPSTREQDNAVTLTFVNGYGAAAAVPDTFKQAIRLLVGHWWANRESVVVGTIVQQLQDAVESLVWSERIEVLEAVQ